MFANYRDAAALAADLVNTVGSITGNDYIPDLDAFRASLSAHGLEHERPTQEDLAAVRPVRSRLRDAFFASDDATLASVLNSILRSAGARPEVTNHDGTWHLHYVDDDAPLADRIAVLAGMGLAALISDLGRTRLGVCCAYDCLSVLVGT